MLIFEIGFTSQTKAAIWYPVGYDAVYSDQQIKHTHHCGWLRWVLQNTHWASWLTLLTLQRFSVLLSSLSSKLGCSCWNILGFWIRSSAMCCTSWLSSLSFCIDTSCLVHGPVVLGISTVYSTDTLLVCASPFSSSGSMVNWAVACSRYTMIISTVAAVQTPHPPHPSCPLSFSSPIWWMNKNHQQSFPLIGGGLTSHGCRGEGAISVEIGAEDWARVIHLVFLYENSIDSKSYITFFLLTE